MSNAQTPIDRQTIPPEIDRWNWGAFLLNWIWGIGNNTFIALLALIPLVGFVMLFVLGAKGSRWAWRNGRWDSVAHFKLVQRMWAIWGAVIWFGAIVFFCAVFGGVFFLLKNSEAYRLGVAKLAANPAATALLGTPISTGYPYGSISINGSSGKAALSFSARGPRAAGVVFLEAVKRNGAWSITRLALKIDGRDEMIDLVNGARDNST
jgi:hypothetical protein